MLISRMSRHSEKLTDDAELLQGTLDMLILKVVAIQPIHGYGIMQRLERMSREALRIRQGSLYPALYRLENKGWLKSAWKNTDGGRNAKYYSLTRSGRKRLDEERASWSNCSI